MSNELALKEERNITDNVLNKINQFRNNGEIYFPDNYSPENALKSAWLKLQEITDKNSKPALEVCTKESIANALLNMVIQGLNPAKNQCYFIPYGNKLTLMRSYFGSIAVAKQFGEIKEICAEVIYENDKIENEIKRGKTIITSHKRAFGNIDKTKIKGAYATIIYNDDTDKAESTHAQYTEEMAKRTVINKICKQYINTKDDSNLNMIKQAFCTSDEEAKVIEVEYEIEQNANKQVIDIETEGPQELQKEVEIPTEGINPTSIEGPDF